MKSLLLIYHDPAKLDAIKGERFNAEMRDRLAQVNQLRAGGSLLDTQMLEDLETETKEVLGGFNLIEAESMDEAVRIAAEFPRVKTGCVEVRPVRHIEMARARVAQR